ncbi:MAG: NUDIX domain-containing protein [Lachnospiraceae bacterium]|nr:NUDIX domain-containing protein [Lachnospiraceae bacterium]
MARTENVTITNMCMVFNGSKVLVQDKKDEDYSGITFPGGHVEKGESFTDAVIREVFEETGLKISSPKICGIKDWMREDGTRYMVLFYKENGKWTEELK